MNAVIEKVRYWYKSPSSYTLFLRSGKSIKDAIEPQIITQTEIYRIIFIDLDFFSSILINSKN